MKPFTWIQIDKVRYEWDGEETILCRTAVGYQNTLSGHELVGMDMEGPDGEPLGELQVDFPSGQLVFMPAGGQLPPQDQYLELGTASGELRVPLSDIVAEAPVSDYLDWNEQELDLWTTLSDAPPVSSAEAVTLTADELLWDADLAPPQADLFAQQASMAELLTHDPGYLDCDPGVELPPIVPPPLDS